MSATDLPMDPNVIALEALWRRQEPLSFDDALAIARDVDFEREMVVLEGGSDGFYEAGNGYQRYLGVHDSLVPALRNLAVTAQSEAGDLIDFSARLKTQRFFGLCSSRHISVMLEAGLKLGKISCGRDLVFGVDGTGRSLGMIELNLMLSATPFIQSYENLLDGLHLDRAGVQAVVDAIESRVHCRNPTEFGKCSTMATPDAKRTAGRLLSCVANLSVYGARLSPTRWTQLMECAAPASVNRYPYFDVLGVVVNNARSEGGRMKPNLLEVLEALIDQGHSAQNVLHAATLTQDPELLRLLLPHFDATALASDGLSCLQVLDQAPPGFKGRADPQACRTLLQAAAARDHARRVVDEITAERAAP